MFLRKTFCQNRKKGIFHFLMNQNRFACIADTDSLCLCIHDNIRRHFQVCCLIYICMAVAGACLNHRNGTLFHNCSDQSLTASWNQNIHILVHLHKLCRCLSGSVRDQLDRTFCDTLCLQSLTDAFHDCFIGMYGVTSTFQNHYISGFKAQSKCIGSHIRSCLINNTDHTQRYPFLTDQKSIWAFFHSQNLTDRIIKGSYLAKALCHSLDPCLCEKQTVKQSFRHMVSFSFFHIKSIGSDQYICVSCQALCDSKKYFIFFICRKVSDLSFGFFCMYSKFSEHFVHVLSPS